MSKETKRLIYIICGIVMTVIIVPLMYRAFVLYQFNQVIRSVTPGSTSTPINPLQNATNSIIERHQIRLREDQRKRAELAEIAHQKQLAEEKAKIEEAERVRRVKKLTSSECQFWKHYYETKSTERGLEKVREHCYE
jgi:hypothetical protein